jgi:hypothetical protein
LSPRLFSGITLCAIREKFPINQEVQPGGRHNHEKLWIECIEFTETSNTASAVQKKCCAFRDKFGINPLSISMIKNFLQVITVFQKTFEEENQGRVLLQTRQR